MTELWVSGYDNPRNEGNVLRYAARNAGEFTLYDEFEPRRKIELILDGTSDKFEFLLNFEVDAGPIPPGGTVASDGDDRHLRRSGQ